MNADLIISSVERQLAGARESVAFWAAEAEKATGEFKTDCERMRAWWADIEDHAAKTLAAMHRGLV